MTDTTPLLPPIVDERAAELVRMYCEKLAAGNPAEGSDEARLLRQFRRALDIYEQTMADLENMNGAAIDAQAEFTPRERVYSFRLQKGRERIAELEEKLLEAGREIGQMAHELGRAQQDRDGLFRSEADWHRLADERSAALIDMTEQRDQRIADLTREWSAQALLRQELEASRRAHEAALVKLKAIENALLERHNHAGVRVHNALEVLRGK